MGWWHRAGFRAEWLVQLFWAASGVGQWWWQLLLPSAPFPMPSVPFRVYNILQSQLMAVPCLRRAYNLVFNTRTIFNREKRKRYLSNGHWFSCSKYIQMQRRIWDCPTKPVLHERPFRLMSLHNANNISHHSPWAEIGQFFVWKKTVMRLKAMWNFRVTERNID